MKKSYGLLAAIVLLLGYAGLHTWQTQAPRQALQQEHRQEPRRAQTPAGTFDYYLLALSWSPTFCLTQSQDPQCSGKGYGFVLHGLWPQYTRGGWPQFCPPATTLSRAEQAKGLTVFVTPKLLKHEWSKHGTCSGLSPSDYLDTADKARASVVIPEQLQAFHTEHYFPAQQIRQMFRQSNPGLKDSSIVVSCRGPQLSEVRVCLDKNLAFTACGKGVKNTCRDGDIRVPSVR